jgi:hypothetical protein
MEQLGLILGDTLDDVVGDELSNVDGAELGLELGVDFGDDSLTRLRTGLPRNDGQ